MARSTANRSAPMARRSRGAAAPGSPSVAAASQRAGADAGNRTDQRILDAACRSFGIRGVQATSLDAVAAEVNVAKQTLLYWFPTKQALLEATVTRAAGELIEAIDRALLGGPSGLDRIDLLIRTIFRFAVRRPDLVGLVRETSRMGPAASSPGVSAMR